MRVTQKHQFTAIIVREDDGYVAMCHELDISCHGFTVDEARNNLVEAIRLFLEEPERSAPDRVLH